MSSTELYRVNADGDVVHYMSFTNAHLGAMLVWRQMGEMYIGSFSLFDMQPVWDLAERPSVPESHRIVMLSTFDNVMVRQENLGRLLTAIDEYGQVFNVGNLFQQARAIGKLYGDKDTIAVCWNQTSVNCNPWVVIGDDDEYRPYNINGTEKNAFGKRHWSLFDEFENPTEASRE